MSKLHAIMLICYYVFKHYSVILLICYYVFKTLLCLISQASLQLYSLRHIRTEALDEYGK